MDRIRELGDASVLRYDATPWSSAKTRSAWKPTCTTSSPTVGSTWSSLRREFFRARPGEVRDIIARLDASIVEWIDEPIRMAAKPASTPAMRTPRRP